MNSRGRKPTEHTEWMFDPFGVAPFALPTVGFTHGYSRLAASRPVSVDGVNRSQGVLQRMVKLFGHLEKSSIIRSTCCCVT
jgi:hypothetical protein